MTRDFSGSRPLSDYAVVKADAFAGWLEPGERPVTGRVWTRSKTTPRIEERRLVSLDRPLAPPARAEPLWLPFEPAPAAENGWFDHMETLEETAFILGTFTASLDGDGGQLEGWRWFNVERVARLRDVLSSTPPVRVDALRLDGGGARDIARPGNGR